MQTDTSPAPTLVRAPIQASPWIVLLVLTLGFFMILLDTTIVNVAIPAMEHGLGASFDQILWVINGYVLVYAVLLITAGRLGDIFGPKRLFILGVSVFTLASAANALAGDANQLILFRVIQGVGGALLTPQTLAILPSIFPPERRGAAFGVWGAVMGIAAVLGPTLGGFLVSTFDWQSIFFINVPIGIVAAVAAMLLMPEVRSYRSHHLDFPGMVLASTGLFSLIYALVEGQRYGWGPITSLASFSLGPTRWSLLSIYSLIVYGLILLVAFVLWETRAREPLLPLTLFRDRNFSVANLVGAAVGFTMGGLFIPITIFLQSVLGMSAVHAGLAVVPMSIGVLVASPLAGRLSDAINGKYLITGGTIAAAGGAVMTASVLALSNTSWSLALPLLIIGLGVGFVFAPLTTLAMRDLDPALAGAASGFLTTDRQVAMATGTAVVGSVLATRYAAALPGEAARLAHLVPLPYRSHFVSTFQAASHGSQNFGTGQAVATFPAGVPPAIAHQLTVLTHQVFAQSFLTAARPSILVAAGAILTGTLFAGLLRGGRSAADARRAVEIPEELAQEELVG